MTDAIDTAATLTHKWAEHIGDCPADLNHVEWCLKALQSELDVDINPFSVIQFNVFYDILNHSLETFADLESPRFENVN